MGKYSVSTVTLVTQEPVPVDPDPSAHPDAAPDPGSESGQPVLHLDGVGVTIDGVEVLRDVSLSVRRDEHWALIGPNGGGKSTIVRVAALALHPSVGSVRVLGQLLGRIDIRPLRGRIGLSSSSLVDQLRGSLTCEEIVRCGRFGALEPWWHTYDDADTMRAESLLAQLGLDGYRRRTFATLSSGERQRALLARTLMPRPDLLLLDEPTAGLDFAGREELVIALQRMAVDPEAPPSILVTHRVEDLPATTTHVAAVRDGRLVASGPIEPTLTGELLSDLFGLQVELTRHANRWSARATGEPASQPESALRTRPGRGRR